MSTGEAGILSCANACLLKATMPAVPATPPMNTRREMILLLINSSLGVSLLRPVESIRLLGEAVGKIVREFVRFVLVETMGGHQAGEESAVDAARHVVPGRNGEIGARVVVEAHGVVET